MKVTISSGVKNGRLQAYKRFIEVLKEFEGKSIELVIKTKRKYRSNDQNRYYFGVVVPLIKKRIEDDFGERMTKEEVHEFLKGKFNMEEKASQVTGELLHLPKSTTALSTTEFMEYVKIIRAWAIDFFEMDIPEPNEQIEIDV